jgi:hypothetical protein
LSGVGKGDFRGQYPVTPGDLAAGTSVALSYRYPDIIHTLPNNHLPKNFDHSVPYTLSFGVNRSAIIGLNER